MSTFVTVLALLALSFGSAAKGLIAGGGLTLAHLLYEYSHYSAHFRPARNPLARARKRHHMLHHFADETNYFGVTSPLWDYVFGTLPTAPSVSSRLSEPMSSGSSQ